jgi:hypothetical protein
MGWTDDGAGNRLSDGTTSYTYDALNRLLTAGATATSHDGDGVLVQQGRPPPKGFT